MCFRVAQDYILSFFKNVFALVKVYGWAASIRVTLRGNNTTLPGGSSRITIAYYLFPAEELMIHGLDLQFVENKFLAANKFRIDWWESGGWHCIRWWLSFNLTFKPFPTSSSTFAELLTNSSDRLVRGLSLPQGCTNICDRIWEKGPLRGKIDFLL